VFRFSWGDAAVVGLACMFSSTILVVKLLPTTTLHQAHMGSLAIGVLILQDLLAVAALAIMRGAVGVQPDAWGLPGLLHDTLGMGALATLAVLAPAALALTAAALAAEQFLLRPMMRRIDKFEEGIYLLAIAWCLVNAAAWKWAGLSHVAGAFVAGVAVARSPVSLFISTGLQPLRDFFLVLFFFVVGAGLDLPGVRTSLVPAAAVAAGVMLVRPFLFDRAFRALGEPAKLSGELGWRLNQLSEFGLLIAFLGRQLHVISDAASDLIVWAVILSLIASSYIVVFAYPTPIGTKRSLHQD
jgi:glutathione-regulated potassium-efflux system ancillary protein KefC